MANEARILRLLHGQEGFAKLYYYGQNEDYDILVMDLLGPTLEESMLKNHGRLSLKTVVLIGYQVVQRIDVLHSASYIHRDIKSEDFLRGIDENSIKIYMTFKKILGLENPLAYTI